MQLTSEEILAIDFSSSSKEIFVGTGSIGEAGVGKSCIQLMTRSVENSSADPTSELAN